MVKASVSLWSADLTNLESEIRRAEPFANSFHIDVADGSYAPPLLFFPDIVAAMRLKTEVPFEVHLITRDPERWVGPFADAGADWIVVYLDSTGNPDKVIQMIRNRKLKAGVSLAVDHQVSMVVPYLPKLDLVVVMGTDVGDKGVKTIADGTYEKIRDLVKLRTKLGLAFEIEADGAIRRETVPLLREAGADTVVPGSLMFRNDMKEISDWLYSL